MELSEEQVLLNALQLERLSRFPMRLRSLIASELGLGNRVVSVDGQFPAARVGERMLLSGRILDGPSLTAWWYGVGGRQQTGTAEERASVLDRILTHCRTQIHSDTLVEE